MKKVLALILILLFGLFSCVNIQSKREYIATKKYSFNNKNLYLEVFKVWNGGVFGGEIKSDYITDSLNFRFFVGTFSEHQNLLYKYVDDTIYITKIDKGNKNCQWKTLKDGTQTVECDVDTLEIKCINLSKLIKEHKFE